MADSYALENTAAEQGRLNRQAAALRPITERLLRAARIPADVIWLDIDYQDRNRPFTTNPATFPDLPALTRHLRQHGLRLVTITDLHIAAAPNQGYVPYDSGVAGDHFLKRDPGFPAKMLARLRRVLAEQAARHGSESPPPGLNR